HVLHVHRTILEDERVDEDVLIAVIGSCFDTFDLAGHPKAGPRLWGALIEHDESVTDWLLEQGIVGRHPELLDDAIADKQEDFALRIMASKPWRGSSVVAAVFMFGARGAVTASA